jgi:hypothetical protein
MSNDMEITVPGGPLVCEWCKESVTWHNYVEHGKQAGAMLTLGYLRLTGVFAYGVGPDGALAVLAEVETLAGAAGYLPHPCDSIPDSIRAQYADQIAAILAKREKV